MEIKGFDRITPSVFETRTDPVVIQRGHIAKLIAAAKLADNGRARILLHRDRRNSLQEMIIALPPTSCDVPHINYRSAKSFLALSGQFAVMRFSNDGREVNSTALSAGRWPGARMIRLGEPVWHTIIPLRGDAVFLETIVGPFVGNEFAPWFPSEGAEADRRTFVDKLRFLARSAIGSAAPS
jgi:cupin fold WbuC family metalloprotein